MKIAMASDHAGQELKDKMVQFLRDAGYEPLDFGTASQDPVDYPDYGILVAEAVASGQVDRGVLLCGTGIGMSIVANKFPGVRAALCSDPQDAKISRQHNDANILVLGGRTTEEKTAFEIVKLWLETAFEGGRHARRVEKIQQPEKKLLRKN